jgi:amino acid transporter
VKVQELFTCFSKNKDYEMSNNTTHKIGLATATITGMNAMIGAGIFTAPAILASNIGPAGILTYLFVVVAVWFMAQSIARVAQLFPYEGSFYAYARQWGGHALGITAGASYIIGMIVGIGLLTRIAGYNLVPFFPHTNPELLGATALIILVLVNLFGTGLSQLGQRILIGCTVFPLIAIIGMSLTKANFHLLSPFAPFGFGNVMRATSKVIFGFFGFESAASLFALVRDPERNVPRALTYSVVLVGTLYVLFVGALIVSVPLNLFTTPDVPLAETLKQIFPHVTWLTTIIQLAILSAILGTIHSIIWGASNLVISLTKKLKNQRAHMLIASKKVTTKKTVIFIGLCSFIVFYTLHNIDLFFFLSAVFVVFSYITSMITLLTIKKEWTSGRNIITLVGITTATMILFFALQGLIEQSVKLIH